MDKYLVKIKRATPNPSVAYGGAHHTYFTKLVWVIYVSVRTAISQ